MSVPFKAAIPVNFSNASESIANLLLSSSSNDLEKEIEEKGYLLAFYRELADRKTEPELVEFVIKRLTEFGTTEADKDLADHHLLDNYDLEQYQVEDIRHLLEDYVRDILQGPIRKKKIITKSRPLRKKGHH